MLSDLCTETNILGPLSLVRICVRVRDFSLLTYVNECLINQSIERILECLYKDMAFTQSHRSEEAIADSYDKSEPRLKRTFIRQIKRCQRRGHS